MNCGEYLSSLGYIYPDKHDLKVLTENLHYLDYKCYTFRLNNYSFIVGIFNDYYIHYVDSLINRDGWYDMYPHDIPAARPVEIGDLMLKPFAEEELCKNKNEIFEYLKSLGWTLSISLKDFQDLNAESQKYFLELNGVYYEVWTMENDTTYLIQFLSVIDPHCFDNKLFVENHLPSVKDHIDNKINQLMMLRKKLP